MNPTGKFVIGGPQGDSGLTGRKIIVDTYGGWARHGGGAFSGKDPTKVDRSAAYAARHIAKNMVAAGVADEMLVQLSYAIGCAEPISINVNTFGRSHVNMSDGEIAEKVKTLFRLRPAEIERDLKLRFPIYEETAAYFREITIKELKHVGGEMALTAAAMVCSKVEWLNARGRVITAGTPAFYKCYFETSDGKRQIYQEFAVGDQARCQQFRIESGSAI